MNNKVDAMSSSNTLIEIYDFQMHSKLSLILHLILIDLTISFWIMNKDNCLLSSCISALFLVMLVTETRQEKERNDICIGKEQELCFYEKFHCLYKNMELIEEEFRITNYV